MKYYFILVSNTLYFVFEFKFQPKKKKKKN